nr:hypothetical protein [Haliscomenobacter sp.]
MFQIIGDRDDFGGIASLYFFLHLANHLCADFGKVVDEVQGVLDLVGDTSGEFTKEASFSDWMSWAWEAFKAAVRSVTWRSRVSF